MVPRQTFRVFTVFVGFLLALGAFWPTLSVAQDKPAVKTTSQKVGYSGDPARKRGMELGFDFGLKAGKADKAAGKKPNPAEHEAFKDPSKYYRHEFGSRASFNGGFKSGFVGGYQQAFGKKVQLKPDGTMGSTTTPGTASKVKTSTPSAPSNPAADAL